jgi:hypothetical protein
MDLQPISCARVVFHGHDVDYSPARHFADARQRSAPSSLLRLRARARSKQFVQQGPEIRLNDVYLGGGHGDRLAKVVAHNGTTGRQGGRTRRVDRRLRGRNRLGV